MHNTNAPSREVVDRFIQLALDDVSPYIIATSRSDAEAVVREEVGAAIKGICDVEFMEEFYALYKFPGTTPADYANRWVKCSDRASAVIGIRFRCRRLEPFVEMIARDFPINDSESMMGLKSAARDVYEVFEPVKIGLRASEEALRWGALDECEAYLQYFAVRLRDVETAVGSSNRFELRRSKDYTFYSDYEQIYESLHRDDEFYRMEVPMVTESDYRECVEKGMAFVAVLEDSPIGYVAAMPSSEFGIRGYTVFECVLRKEYRGHGWGGLMLKRLACEVAREGNLLFLYSTVHYKNAASWRAMLKVGMQPIGQFVFTKM